VVVVFDVREVVSKENLLNPIEAEAFSHGHAQMARSISERKKRFFLTLMKDINLREASRYLISKFRKRAANLALNQEGSCYRSRLIISSTDSSPTPSNTSVVIIPPQNDLMTPVLNSLLPKENKGSIVAGILEEKSHFCPHRD
jgi:hypothetical protein